MVHVSCYWCWFYHCLLGLLAAGYVVSSHEVHYVTLFPSEFTVDQVMYNTSSSISPLVSHRMDCMPNSCPCDTFTIDSDTGSVSLIRSLNFTNHSIECTEFPDAQYHPILQSYQCYMIRTSQQVSYSVLLIVYVIPDYGTRSLFTLTDTTLSATYTTGTDQVVQYDIHWISVPGHSSILLEYTLTDNSSFAMQPDTVRCTSILKIVSQPSALPSTMPPPFYNLTMLISAVPSYPHINTATVNVVLEGSYVNHHTPSLIMNNVITVSSDTPRRSVIGHVSGVDEDVGLAGALRYSIVTQDSLLGVNPITGELFLSQSDGIQVNEAYNVTIRVHDLGATQKSTENTITIFIDSPVKATPYINVTDTFTVGELTPPGTTTSGTLTLLNTDTTNISTTLKCDDCSECFQLISTSNYNEYAILLTQQHELNYEIIPYYTCSVAIADLATSLLQAEKEITVYIEDQNDSPYFEQSTYSVTVSDIVPVNTVVLVVTANDEDIVDTLTYSIVNGTSLPVSINPSTGLIYSTASLVPVDILIFNVSASDGYLTVLTTVTITIEPMDQTPPAFTAPLYEGVVYENISSVDPIFRLSAIDTDRGCAGSIEYTIIQSEPPYFTIDSYSGLLYVKSTGLLNYQIHRHAIITVKASSLGDFNDQYGIAKLNLTVLNSNDNRPVVSPIHCPCFIVEESTVQYCSELYATDEDGDVVTFEFESDTYNNIFSINPTTGVVSTTKSIDRELQSIYELYITASDGEHVSEPVKLVVRVIDINDSPPSYQSNSITVSVPQDTPIGTIVADLGAVQEDTGINALTLHTYSTDTDQSIQDTFNVDPLSGDLTLSKSITTGSTYTFDIVAVDILNNTQQTNIAVTIEVEPNANLRPIFPIIDYRVTVASNLPVGSSVIMLTATDTDPIQYSLVESNSLFTINTQTGVITLNQTLYDDQDLYTLNVSATDGTLTTYVSVHVTIYQPSITLSNDIYTHNPGVGVCSYTASLSEGGVTGGETIVTMETTQSEQLITYAILDASSHAHLFAISDNNITGVGGAGNAIDRLTTEAVYLTVRATYGQQLFHLCSVTIIITDINNNGPVFDSHQYSIEIYQVTPIGSSIFQFKAVDLDQNDNAVTRYTLLTSSAPFTVDNVTGQTRLTGSITATQYILTVLALDNDDPSMNDTASLVVNVLSTVNSQPIFIDTLSEGVAVSENTLVSSVITRVNVSDIDTGSQGSFLYCLKSGTDVLTISNNGIVILTNPLDYESMDHHNVTVMVYDSSPNPQYNQLSFTLSVEDVNDEIPAFTTPSYTGYMVEESSTGTDIVTVTATDRDTGTNIVYSLNPPSIWFDIDPSTGTISVSTVINRESLDNDTITLTVTATDSNSEPLSSTASVTIVITDNNDYRPNFIDNDVSVVIPESTSIGSVVGTVNAKDEDYGRNGLVHYTMNTINDYLYVDSITGDIILYRPVDYETDQLTFDLTITATDSGATPLSSSATVSVSITNVNDDYPLFSHDVFYCQVNEGTNDVRSITFPDEQCRVNTTDSDTVFYYIEASHTPFNINGTTGVIGLKSNVPLDYETVSQYVLTVIARDDGTPPLTAVAQVIVQVIDRNDEKPVFDNLPSSIWLPDALPVGSVVFTAHATDSDAIDQTTGLTYALLSETDSFDINHKTGELIVDSRLIKESYSIEILATDSEGTSTTSDPVILNILVTNDNPSPPYYPSTNPIIIEVLSTATTGTEVYQLNATDDMASIKYYTPSRSYFLVDRNNGSIRVAESLAGLVDELVIVEILVIDSGAPPLYSLFNLTILVVPPTDTPPVFTSPEYSMSVSESKSSEFYILGHVLALVNHDFNSDVFYTISNGNNIPFSSNSSTGGIFVDGALDRETVSEYQFTVQSHINTITSLDALVHVTVTDINDNRPLFPPSYTNITIPYTYAVGDEVFRIFSFDNDEEPSTISFTISPSNDILAVNESSGVVRLQATPTNSSHSYTITANDGVFDRQLHTTVTVNNELVKYTDIACSNDTVSVLEDTPPGTLIYTMNIPGTVFYRLIYNDHFRIHPSTGEVYLATSLDRETQQYHNLSVIIWDGLSENTTVCTLNVGVVDVNDNTPVFRNSSYYFQVLENTPINSTVGIVSALDDDDQSLDLIYHIESLNYAELFTIDSSGYIRVNDTIDRETLPQQLELLVSVNDIGDKKSFVNVVIEILDENDNRPTLTSSLPNVTVTENVPVGTHVLTVTALDIDQYSATNYTLANEGSVPFIMNASRGAISTSATIDYESGPQEYQLMIVATDTDNPLLTDTTILHVSIHNDIDTVPVMANITGTVTVSENIPIHSFVISVADPFAPPPHPVTYSLSHDYFYIELFTGTIRTLASLDHEENQHHNLSITAYYSTDYYTVMNVTIEVTDYNDHSPQATTTVFTVPEDVPVGDDIIFNIGYVDSDEGSNGVVKFVHILDPECDTVFNISTSGEVTLKQPLDRETRGFYHFKVFVSDDGVPPLYSTHSISITIDDVNDNAPVFDKDTFTFIVSTPVVIGEQLFIVTASDEDYNSTIEYQLLNGTEWFTVNSNTGVFSIHNLLYLGQHYSLLLQAVDEGGLNTTVPVIVDLKHCNYNNLTFVPSWYSVDIREDTPTNTLLLSTVVNDYNIEPAQQLHYYIPESINNSDYFNINSSNGELYLIKGLDYETIEHIDLLIRVRNADSSRLAEATVTVTVTDTNDNSPMFLETPYAVFLRDDTELGTDIFTASAIDADTNTTLTYSIINSMDSPVVFTINDTSGVITLTALDADTPHGERVEVTITATDNGEPLSLSTNETLIVTVLSSNAPSFSKPIYVSLILESTPSDTVIDTIQAHTASNTSNNAPLFYSIVEPIDSKFPFSLDPYIGNLSINDRGLDREVTDLYQFFVQVEDTVLSISTQVEVLVHIEDVNDNSPVFSQPLYTFIVDENIPIGSVIGNVSASDQDTPPFAQITFSLSSDDFQVDPLNGILKTLTSIDYELQQSHQFIIYANDGGSPIALQGMATVRVIINNLNDNPPVIHSLTNQIPPVPEYPPKNHLVSLISGSDPDNDDIYYDLAIGKGSGNFIISDDGLLQVRSNVTVLPEPSYTLTITASDGVYTVNASIVISILDVNDHSPMFNEDIYYANVTEESSAGVYVTTVTATDGDRGVNAQIQYSGNLDEFIVNAETGEITTSSIPTDRESNEEYKLIIIARDGGDRTGTTQVIISVKDINDNIPQFTQSSYTVYVTEESNIGTPVLMVNAIDHDEGINGTVTYDIVEDTVPFFIYSGTGLIVVFGNTDYEIKPVWNITVTATDGGGLVSSPVLVTINLRNKADANPQFSQSVYQIDFEECPTGCSNDPVFTVNITYPDECIAMSVSIFNPEPNLPFLIHSTMGIISAIGNIRRITKDFYTFTILAKCSVIDNGMLNELFATSSVEITITDTNEPPVITPFVTFIEMLSEAVPINSTVTIITGTDHDLGNNSILRYTLEEDNVPFSIDPVTGELKTSDILDRETESLYIITVMVSDQGTPSLSATGEVYVTVTDENDSPPVITACVNYTDNDCVFETTIPEGTPMGTDILTLEIIDPDTIGNITFQLSTSVFSFQPVMDINNAIVGGVISTVSELDRETQDWYEFEAIVSDGFHTAVMLISINITDINDETPVFDEDSYTATINENYPTLKPILAISATDNDIGENAVISYELLGVPQLNNLTINPSTGEIYFLQSPNYEISSRIDLLAQASDSGGLLSDTVAIVINIIDVNDNAPVFSKDNYIYSISENALFGSDIGYVTANDADSGNNGLVTYEMESEYFEINSVNGLITSKQSLDRESSDRHEVIVTATDNAGGNDSLSTTAIVTINVLDVNDNSPMFIGLSNDHVVLVSEQSTIGTTVLSVNASDEDLGLNANISFFLTGDNSNDFILESMGNQLSILIAKPLNHESIDSYELMLSAVDSGIPSKTTTVALKILVTDENDNKPIFVAQYDVTISEDTPQGSLIVTVEARDLDSSDHTLLYAITNDDQDIFMINSTTGDMYINKPLDYETTQQYVLTITASEQRSNPQSAQTTVTITILDINDNPPIFVCGGSPCSYRQLHVTENQISPLIIANFSVMDADSVSNINSVSYSIASGDRDDGSLVFVIDPLSGILTVLVPLDREYRDEYQLTVAASDNGAPSLTGTISVTVTVGDVNDNVPVGGEQVVHVYLKNGNIGSSDFGQVLFSDKDIVNSYRFDYEAPPTSNWFTLSSDGIMSVSPHAPLINTGLHQIPINITDTLYNGTKTYTVTIVTIRVINVTDDITTNSISILIGNTSITRFIDNHLVQFSEAVYSYLQGNIEDVISDVIVYSVTQYEVDSVEIQLALQLLDDDGEIRYLHKDLLQYYMFINRWLIEGSTHMVILTEELDYCSSEMCGRNGLCQFNKYHYLRPLAINRDKPVVYTGLGTYTSVSCDCYTGKTGQTCSTEGELTCDEFDCGSNGHCVMSHDVIGCQCNHGYVGKSCDIPLQSHDLCQSNPCANGGTCTFSHVGFTCTCKPGYTGNTCTQPDTSTDNSCHGNPCLHGAQCSNTSNNGYQCTCPDGYTGQQCQVFVYNQHCPLECEGCIYTPNGDVHCIPSTACTSSSLCSGNSSCVDGTCVDECDPNPCSNGGECVRMLPGYHCVCEPGFNGPNCQLTGISLLSGDSILLLPSLDLVPFGDISLEIATLDTTSNVTVIHIGGSNDMVQDHYTVSIVEGYIHCVLSLGGGSNNQLVFQFNEFPVNDGQWYTISLHYNTNAISISVTKYTLPYKRQIMHALTEGNYYLDTTLPVIIGKAPAQNSLTNASKSFIGCVRDVTINGEVSDFIGQSLYQTDTASGCRFTDINCGPTPNGAGLCANNGECIGEYSEESGYHCVCPATYSGSTCDKVTNTIKFTGNFYIQYEFINEDVLKRSTAELSSGINSIILSFSTISSNGVIVQIGQNKSDHIILKITDGHITFSLSLNNGINASQSSITAVSVSDQQIHNVTFTRKGREYQLVLDDRYSVRGVADGDEELLDIAGNEVYIGSDPLLRNGFAGCLHGVKIDNKDTPTTAGSNEHFIATPSDGAGTIRTCSDNDTPTIHDYLKIFDDLYIVGGVVLGLLLIMSVCFIIVSKSASYCYYKRRDKLKFNSRRDPIFSPVNPVAISRSSLRLSAIRGVDSNFLERTNSFEHFAISSSEDTSTNNKSPPRLTPSPDQGKPLPNKPLTINDQFLQRLPRLNPVSVPTIPESHVYRPEPHTSRPEPHTSRSEPQHAGKPEPYTTRPPPLISPKRSSKQATSLDPMTGMELRESDQESNGTISPVDARNYIMTKVARMNEEAESSKDSITVFNDEGDYISLGSIGSLHDIVLDVEEEEAIMTKMKIDLSEPSTPSKHKPSIPSSLLTSTKSPAKPPSVIKYSNAHTTATKGPSSKISPKILKRAVPSKLKKKRFNSEKLLLMEQLKDSTNQQQWLAPPTNASKTRQQYQVESEFL